jgi:hypothetical protein
MSAGRGVKRRRSSRGFARGLSETAEIAGPGSVKLQKLNIRVRVYGSRLCSAVKNLCRF